MLAHSTRSGSAVVGGGNKTHGDTAGGHELLAVIVPGRFSRKSAALQGYGGPARARRAPNWCGAAPGWRTSTTTGAAAMRFCKKGGAVQREQRCDVDHRERMIRNVLFVRPAGMIYPQARPDRLQSAVADGCVAASSSCSHSLTVSDRRRAFSWASGAWWCSSWKTSRAS